jgi:hypothetical protein
MFGLISKKKHDEIVNKLAVKVACAEEKLQQLRDKKNPVDQKPVINFPALEPFSIERRGAGDRGKTVFGYFLKNKDGERQVCEWIIWCNADHHNLLVAEYEKWLAR